MCSRSVGNDVLHVGVFPNSVTALMKNMYTVGIGQWCTPYITYFPSLLLTYLFSIFYFRTRTLRCEGSVHMDLSTSTNPLLQKKSLPLFQDINSVHVKPALDVDLEALKKDFSGLTIFVRSLFIYVYGFSSVHSITHL